MRNRDQDKNALTPALRELEDALGDLQPARSSVQLADAMFEAGRLSAERTRLVWQIAAGAMAACLVLALVFRPAPRETVQVVENPTSPTVSGQSEPNSGRATVTRILGRTLPGTSTEYLDIRAAVLEKGPDALPANETMDAPEAQPTVAGLLGMPKEAPKPSLARRILAEY